MIVLNYIYYILKLNFADLKMFVAVTLVMLLVFRREPQLVVKSMTKIIVMLCIFQLFMTKIA